MLSLRCERLRCMRSQWRGPCEEDVSRWRGRVGGAAVSPFFTTGLLLGDEVRESVSLSVACPARASEIHVSKEDWFRQGPASDLLRGHQLAMAFPAATHQQRRTATATKGLQFARDPSCAARPPAWLHSAARFPAPPQLPSSIKEQPGHPAEQDSNEPLAFTANPEDYTARGKIITPRSSRWCTASCRRCSAGACASPSAAAAPSVSGSLISSTASE